MKIIEPSASIIEDELAKLSVYQRIDRCASVCYQRPPKVNERGGRSFCRQMIARKHFVPLEMAVVHLVMDSYRVEDYADKRYLMVHTSSAGEPSLVSGSIRAWMELPEEYGSRAWNFLAEQFPLFFTESDSPRGVVRFAQEHEIPWQHRHVAVRVVCSRAISHQLVRHRPVSILQESQRYCRYDGKRVDGEVLFIRPEWVDDEYTEQGFIEDCSAAAARYIERLAFGLSPQRARGVLPNDCKTELIMYASLPEWMHILDTDTMRCSSHADPEMQRIMLPLREEFKRKYPEAEW